MWKWVFEATKLTCSAGVGPNKMIAKICSDMNKPNGTFKVKFDGKEIIDFMNPLSIRKIPGVGWVTEGVLNHLGILTCEDVKSNGALLLAADYKYMLW